MHAPSLWRTSHGGAAANQGAQSGRHNWLASSSGKHEFLPADLGCLHFHSSLFKVLCCAKQYRVVMRMHFEGNSSSAVSKAWCSYFVSNSGSADDLPWNNCYML